MSDAPKVPASDTPPKRSESAPSKPAPFADGLENPEAATVKNDWRASAARRMATRAQRAPFSVHDVEQVILTPLLHAWQTAMHCSRLLGLYDEYSLAAQT